MDERIRNSETIQTRVILPGLLNDHGILFGGTALQWMDEVAYITATRYSKMRMVTVSVEKVNFIIPVYSGAIVEVRGRIIKTGSVKVVVQIELYTEDPNTGVRSIAIHALFTFVAVDKNHKPIPLNSKQTEQSEATIITSDLQTLHC